MQKYKKTLVYILAAYSLFSIPAYASNTWHLEEDQNWDLIASDSQKNFFTKIEEAQVLVNKGKAKKAKKQFEAIKEDFPEFLGKELNLFIKAELLLSKMNLSGAARKYDKLLSKYPDSVFKDKSVKRQYEIGMTYLNGRKKVFIGIIKLNAVGEGIGILEKMIDHAGFDSPLGIDASVEIAGNYEKREKFDEAYLKWYEIYSLSKADSVIKRDALFGMAKTKQGVYNKNPEARKPFYDASCLRSAKSYYEMLKTYYPEYANEVGVEQTLNIITEQLAYKELSIGLYYQKVGNIQSANLYYDMVISNWPKSKSAQIAQNKLNENTKS